MWVPLIESGEHLHEGADYFVEKYLTELLERDPLIDTIILGCTHYPLLQEKIENFLNQNSKFKIQNYTIISQGEIVAESLADYLNRHPEIANKLTTATQSMPTCQFLTTESASKFAESASMFLDEKILAKHIEL
jgi:glutamate racemase